MTDAIARTVVEHIGAIIGSANVIRGEVADAYATDVYRSLARPLAVVRPGTVDEVQAIVRKAAAAGIALSVRGGGASYTDGYLPASEGQILLDLSRLNRIVEISEIDGYVVVEAGTTWAALKSALDERGLRTPFWGPFSGLVATVGGSMSQNTISHGSGAHGISAQSVLSFDIITADGALLQTGSAAAGASPFARHFGPDLTGLFTGDSGAFGIKVRIALPLLRARPAHRPISFAFTTFEAMHEGMRQVSLERIEDTQFALDAALSQGQIARQDGNGAALGMALSILRSSPSWGSGLKQIAHAALSAKSDIRSAAFTAHYIVEGFNDAEVRARLHRIRQLMQGLSRECTATVPALVRGTPFAPLYNVLGPAGERWVPLHGIIAHSAVPAFQAALVHFYAEREETMRALGVWTGGMFATVGSGGFLYEIAIYWPDAISAYHRNTLPADHLAQIPHYPENLEARAYVHRLKDDLIALYAEHDAVHFQIGKAYPYIDRLKAPAQALACAIKRELDPAGLISQRSLGLP